MFFFAAIASASSLAAASVPCRLAGGSRCVSVVELGHLGHATRREQAREQRVHAGLFEGERGARRHVAGFD